MIEYGRRICGDKLFTNINCIINIATSEVSRCERLNSQEHTRTFCPAGEGENRRWNIRRKGESSS